MSGPRLSLCLIAKDEARFLPDCLASVKGVVDELVVADTGSVDGTPELARSAGARVVSHPWQEDFAAARNAALAACTGDWVLVLDADERLAPGAGPILRDAIAAGGFHCGLLPLHDASRLDARPDEILSGAARRGEPSALPRLLLRDPELAWRGSIHESVGDWLSQGRSTRFVPAPILHLGAVPELRAAREKDQRNLRMLARYCAEVPNDPVRRTYLGRERHRVGDRAGARADLQQAWADLRAAWAGPSPWPDGHSTVNVLAFILLEDGQPADALAVLDQAAPHVGDHPNHPLLVGAALDLLSDAPAARIDAVMARLQANLDRKDHPTRSAELNPGATSWAAATVLGQLALKQQAWARAHQAFARALADRPNHQPALLGQLEAQVGLGQGAATLAAVEPLLAGTDADPWMIAAWAAFTLGDRRTAATLLGQTRGRPWQSGSRASRARALSRQLSRDPG